jgi:SAM-dependent methyltransferase
MDVSATVSQVDLPEMPFYWRIRQSVTESHPSILARLPYAFQVLDDLELVIQARNPNLLSCLAEMYREESNIGFLQDGHSLAQGYGGDFLDFIRRSLEGRDLQRVVEIGCGACYVLERLRDAGYQVCGVDPSPIAIAKGRQKRIRVIPDFYPTPVIDFKADLIFHADVLEHVADPVAFLREQRDGLSDRGILIANVPDCTTSIARGDISIASHQHLNSFDDRSLANVITAAGLHVVSVERSKFGGSLYALASVNPVLTNYRPTLPSGGAQSFLELAVLAQERFSSRVSPLLDQGRHVGFYMPLRSIPYLASIGALGGLRLFDDIAHWHHGYIDGLDVPIENFADLIAHPVQDLFVMSLTFGEVVRDKVQAVCPNIRVVTLEELLLD